MFCAKCGKKIDNDSDFCLFCGQKINAKVDIKRISDRVSEKAKAPEGQKSKMLLIGITAILVTVAVVVVVFFIVKVIDGSRFGKTFSERLFLSSAEDYTTMTGEHFKEMLDDEEILYMQMDKGVMTSLTDPFMGYDCIYGYGEYDNDFGATPSGVAWISDSSYFYVAFDTEDDFKDGQESIKKYLEKELVKKSVALKTDGYFSSGNTYLVECSDEGVDEFWDKLPTMEDGSVVIENNLFGDDNSLLRKCKRHIQSGKKLDKKAFRKITDSMGYKMYKFVQVCYLQMEDGVRKMFPSDKSYTDYMCVLQVVCIPMTEEQYIAFAGIWGYDAIEHKDIVLSKIETDIDLSVWEDEYIRLPWQDAGKEMKDAAENVLYFMQEHDYDLLSGEYVKDDMEKRKWYLDHFRWDIRTNTEAELEEYRNSVEIYLAVTNNYNSAMHKPFESELDKALYLADKDYNMDTGGDFRGADEKRLYFMQKYCYDIAPQKKMGAAIAEAFFAYTDYIENTFKEDRIIGYNLIYIDDDDVPECLVWVGGAWDDRAEIVYVLSNKGGSMQSVIGPYTLDGYSSFSYTPQLGKFALEVWESDSGWTDMSSAFTLEDSDFEFVCSLEICRFNFEDYSYRINNQDYTYCTVYDPTPELDEFYEQYGNFIGYNNAFEYRIYGDNRETYSTLLAAYDALRMITYDTYEYYIYQFEVNNGMLTVAADDGAITSEGVRFQKPFSFSCLVAEDCIWEDGQWIGKNYESERQIDAEIIMREVNEWREAYKINPDNVKSPTAIYFDIVDNKVVRVYTASSE